MAYDRRCVELARHFVPHVSEVRVNELAQHIQDAVEAWIQTTIDEIQTDLAKPPAPAQDHNMIAYGTQCTWWDSAEKMAHTGRLQPVCPHCTGGVTVVTQAEWDRGIKSVRLENRLDYPTIVKFGRGKCRPDIKALVDEWRAEGSPT